MFQSRPTVEDSPIHRNMEVNHRVKRDGRKES